MEEEGCLTKVTCGANRRLHISWGAGNELHLCDIAPTGVPASSRRKDEGSNLTVVKWGWQSGSERRVCYDCLEPWIEIQKQRTNGLAGEGNWWASVLEYSERVSQVLGRQDDLRVPREVPANEEDMWIAVRRIVWELLEIFYVRPSASLSAQIQDFLGWLQRNSQVVIGLDRKHASDVIPLETMLRGIYECELPEEEEQYWASVELLVLLGFNEAAIDLLGIHSAWTRWQNRDTAVRAQFEILESLITILQKMPRLAGSNSASLGVKVFNNVSDYNLYKSKWSLACRQLLQNEVLWQECSESSARTAKGAKTVLNGLLGQETALRDGTRAWSELLCAQLLHRYPTIESLSELSSLTEYCMERCSKDSEVTVDILLAILNDNVQEVISLSSQTLGPWFMAHAPELILARPGQRELREVLTPIQGRQGNQFEFFVLDFAEALMTNPSMWQTVCEYLAWCPTCGETALQTFLSHLPLTIQDDKAALLAMQIANKHGLPAVAAQISRSVGLHSWSKGQRARALFWLRGHDDVLKVLEATGRQEQEISPGQWEDEEECWKLLELLEDMPDSKKHAVRLKLARSMAEHFLH
ncbi:nuclear pore complex protein Nup85 [Chloropicon primus]|nr:nuclear pore complex protein Nup85 [Chloropicon primus]